MQASQIDLEGLHPPNPRYIISLEYSKLSKFRTNCPTQPPYNGYNYDYDDWRRQKEEAERQREPYREYDYNYDDWRRNREEEERQRQLEIERERRTPTPQLQSPPPRSPSLKGFKVRRDETTAVPRLRDRHPIAQTA